MQTEVYGQLNKMWKATAKTIFKRDIGELSEYESWLGDAIPRFGRKSAISGEEVVLSSANYAKDSRIISLEENLHPKLKFTPLEINEIKDIDSIIEAIRERIYYTGNVVLGNSGFIERSTNVHDSQFVLASTYAVRSKYLAYCSDIRYCESLFGCDVVGASSNVIRGFHGFKARRCFEIWNVSDSSDCLYSNNTMNSNECIFCFNLWNARHAIGNLTLSPERYKAIKEKLLEELCQILEQKKALPSFIDLFPSSESEDSFNKTGSTKKTIDAPPDSFEIEKINEGFRTATKILLRKQLNDIRDYERWLSRNVPTIVQIKSALSGTRLFISDEFPYRRYLEKRVICLEESKVFDYKISDIDLNFLDFENVAKVLEKIAYFSPQDTYGTFSNVGQSYDYGDGASNLYRSAIAYNTRHAAYSFWPRDSQYEYGCNRTFESNICLKTYYSTNLSRCFEVDSSRQCSDLYFGHNCENVHDSMFVFNSKNMRNAIGNNVLSPEKYKRIKSILIEQIANELEEKKDFRYSIYKLVKGMKG